MRKPGHKLRQIIGLAVLGWATVIGWFLFRPSIAATQVPPPPPPPNTPTWTPTPTDTGTATNTPTPTGTSTPTNTPTPTNTSTSTTTPTRTNTPTATPTGTATTGPPPPPPVTTRTPRPKPTVEPRPNPNCQSAVEGSVINAAGQRVAGATVTIKGEGWSSGILTNDEGRYGFAGLCAGTVTLQATLPDGQVSPVATANLTGQNTVYLDLVFLPAGATVTGEPTITGQTSTPEPEMPATGQASWLLVGGALLGMLVLLSAGARRAFRG